jgi:hypothetical protein
VSSSGVVRAGPVPLRAVPTFQVGYHEEKGTSRCPGVLTCGSQQRLAPSHIPEECSDEKGALPLFREPPLPAYSGVTVWAFHPLRVVTRETSVVGREYSTLGVEIRDLRFIGIRSSVNAC